MSILKLTNKCLTICLATQIVLSAQLATVAQAEMLSTEIAIEKYADYANRNFLLGEIRKQELRDEIIAFGIDPAEAEARLEALSDAEIASIIAQMEADSAGAGGGSLVGALVTVFVILLVTDLLCLTKVFKFTRCAVN